jgi:ABC-type spermidine/putrescine transport system permease subunit I
LQLFLPLMVLSLVGALENIPDDVIEAARSLGAGGLTTFFRVVVPLSADGLVLGGTLVFTGSITAYVTPAILGGSRVLMMATLLRQRAWSPLIGRARPSWRASCLATALASTCCCARCAQRRSDALLWQERPRGPSLPYESVVISNYLGIVHA